MVKSGMDEGFQMRVLLSETALKVSNCILLNAIKDSSRNLCKEAVEVN